MKDVLYIINVYYMNKVYTNCDIACTVGYMWSWNS